MRFSSGVIQYNTCEQGASIDNVDNVNVFKVNEVNTSGGLD